MGALGGWVWRWTVSWVAAIAVLLGVAACSHTVYHEVQRGETLYRIGKAYGVSVQRLAKVNRLADPSRLEVGQRLLIPGARRRVPVSVVAPRRASGRRPERAAGLAPALKLSWPVHGGTVTSGFGQRGHSHHDGIDISAPAGVAVYAAQDGEVIYSDSLRGYGNVIIVRHRGGFATVYAHNQRNGVQEGQRVHKGDIIGTVGSSGRTTGANLHFEVRQDNVARNPLYFLPPIEQVAVPAHGHGG